MSNPKLQRQVTISEILAVISSDTHQERFEGRLHFPSQQILPVDVSKEGMSLQKKKKTKKKP